MIEKRWIIKDSDGNEVGNFEGTADSSWIGRELLDGTVVASVEQLPNVDLTPEAVTDPKTPEEKLAGILSACEDPDCDTLEKLKSAIVTALS